MEMNVNSSIYLNLGREITGIKLINDNNLKNVYSLPFPAVKRSTNEDFPFHVDEYSACNSSV